MSNAPIKVKNASDLLKYIEDNDIQYINFNFTDSRGKWQHTAQHVNTFDKDMIAEGVMFDGSSIAGWKAINESDMNLMPDMNKVCPDPFAAQPTIKIFCDVLEPSTKKPYERCPRSIAKAAEAYMQSSGHGTPFISDRKLNFLSSTMCGLRLIRMKSPTILIPRKARIIAERFMTKAIMATAQGRKADISRKPLSTADRTCGRK